MADLDEIIEFCDNLTRRADIIDFKGANNGLQLQNNGTVRKVGAAVDAGLMPFRSAVDMGVDLLVVHHGMFWNTPEHYTGRLFERLKLAMDNNLAVYSSHLPLDAHPEIGNNRLIADALGLQPLEWFLHHEGTPIALLAESPGNRDEIRKRLIQEFGRDITALEFGSQTPGRIAILSGSGRSALNELKLAGTDTLITGELRQEHFNLAQEEGFNLYICGHYATERYGVTALAKQIGERFDLPHVFLETGCPL